MEKRWARRALRKSSLPVLRRKRIDNDFNGQSPVTRLRAVSRDK